MVIRADPSALVRSLTFVVVWMAGMVILLDVWLHLGAALPSADLAHLFDSASETGLGSWIAVTQATLLALTAWAAAGLAARTDAPRRQRRGWLVLAVFFTYLAVDDGTRLHERVGTAFGELDAATQGVAGDFPSYFWQLVFGPALIALGGFTFVFLWRQAPALRVRLVAAFSLLACAVALDFVDGLDALHPLNVYARLGSIEAVDAFSQGYVYVSGFDAITHLSRSVEESLEIVGFALLWGIVLLRLPALAPRVAVEWSAAPAPLTAPEASGAPRQVPEASGVGDLAPSP